MNIRLIFSALAFIGLMGLQQPALAADTAAAEDALPTIIINKITFKNIHPDVNGYQINCLISSHDYKSISDSELMTMGGYAIANTFAEDKTYFSSDPSRRKSSEVGPLKLPTKLVAAKNSTKQDLLKAKSWNCIISYRSKTSLGPFEKTGDVSGNKDKTNGPQSITTDSNSVLYGKF